MTTLMTRAWIVVALAELGCGAGWAQTHVVKKADAVVRAVGVYEWTGEEGKATASRVVPVTVFINGQLQDAGVYLARPVPFALETGTIFEVEKAGVDTGSVELAYARHLVTSGPGSFDDGWLAVGAYKSRPVEKPATFKHESTAKLEVSGGSGPHFAQKPGDADEAKAKPVDRSTAASGGVVVAGDSSDKVGDSDSAKDNVDRPTLKRRATPDQAKAQAKKRGEASVSAVGDLNDDADRPNLHRGKPVTRMEEEDLPPLKGIPDGMQQRVAVSDAQDRPDHDFHRAWESAEEKTDIQARMAMTARAEIAAYTGAAVPATAPAPARVSPRAGRKPALVPKSVPAVTLTDERLEGFVLSYGGAPTYFYSASSPGPSGVTRYVAVVAQREPLGSLKVAMATVTDAQHLDRTPWYRLVDAVDAEASNRASLLFELRSQTTRQFALYRVIGAQADQTFVTESAQ